MLLNSRIDRRTTLGIAGGALGIALAGAGPLVAQTTGSADVVFGAIGRVYLEGLIALNPVAATGLGDHRYDDRLPDFSADGLAKADRFMADVQRSLVAIDRAGLSRDNQVDAILLANELESSRWQMNGLKQWTWDPQLFQGTIGNALYVLAARDFAPWSTRLTAATARMAGIPRLLGQMRAMIDVARVPPVYAETVARQNMGTMDIVDTMLRPQLDALDMAGRAAFDGAARALKSALEQHQKWLDDVLVPGAKGDFRLSVADYDRKLGYAFAGGITRPEIKRRAAAALNATRTEMYGLARTLLAGRADAPATPDNPSADQQQAAIAAALELSYARRPAREALMDEVRATLASATAFLREKQLVSLPDSPVK